MPATQHAPIPAELDRFTTIPPVMIWQDGRDLIVTGDLSCGELCVCRVEVITLVDGQQLDQARTKGKLLPMSEWPEAHEALMHREAVLRVEPLDRKVAQEFLVVTRLLDLMGQLFDPGEVKQ